MIKTQKPLLTLQSSIEGDTKLYKNNNLPNVRISNGLCITQHKNPTNDSHSILPSECLLKQRRKSQMKNPDSYPFNPDMFGTNCKYVKKICISF